MAGPDLRVQLTREETLCLLELAELAVQARNLPELAEGILPSLARMLGSPAAVLYLEIPRLPIPRFLHAGLHEETAASLERHCAAQFRQIPAQSSLPPLPLPPAPLGNGHLRLFPLGRAEKPLGLLGLVLPEDEGAAGTLLVEKALPLLANALSNLVDRMEYEKQIANLNTYLTISSMIAQALDLRDVLEAILYFSMETVSAEAASVLLLDYEKKNFRFYSVEGPAKPVLLTATFPADQGLAGSVLQSQQSEIINDVQNDPRFYGKFDSESGFFTRNMMVLPLTAGEEKIGVLELLNKAGDEDFLEEELLMLQSIAEEIAFAIRNGKLFEVVVKSYCKQRQGENTCKGCKRPLGSWTPCVKYREESVEV